MGRLPPRPEQVELAEHATADRLPDLQDTIEPVVLDELQPTVQPEQRADLRSSYVAATAGVAATHRSHSHLVGRHPVTALPEDFGRVDEAGNVYVRTADGERPVGQWVGGDAAAALSFYAKRYERLALEVDLLARRIDSGTVSPSDASAAAANLQESLSTAAVVGDLDSLATRLAGLAPRIERLRADRRAERERRAAEVRAGKEELVAAAEQVAAGSDWRGGFDELGRLVERWKALPRLDRTDEESLWQRMAAARSSYGRRRRDHLAELEDHRRRARTTKETLVAEAEALVDSTDWAETSRAHRDLMTRWRQAGSAGRAADEQLWRRFRAAQDAFFTARDRATAEQDRELAANEQVKRALLAEAEALVPVQDPRKARATLRSIGRRWDSAGRVPRASARELDDRFKAVETAVRRVDESQQRANPEVRARASDAVQQLEAALASLRAQRADADASGDAARRMELDAAIEAREAWLASVQRSAAG